MRNFYLTVATTLVAASAFASPLSPITPGKLVTYKDWIVGCDNGLACQAVALDEAGDKQADGSLALSIVRGEDVRAPIVFKLAKGDAASGRFRIVVDNRLVLRGELQADDDFVPVRSADAVRLVRTMARGHRLTLFDGSGARLGSVSLAGITAALRHIDSTQGRAGTMGAIIATGKRRSTAKAADLPLITVRKIVPVADLPDAGSMVFLSESSPCAADRMGSTEDSAFSLGSGGDGPQALILLNCGSGAYNALAGVYTGQRDANGKWSFAPAQFDYPATGFTDRSNIPVLVNAEWDPATQKLSSLSKGRGLGDCGSAEHYIWDGATFRLSAASRMDECRGSIEWIPVWRALVRLTP